MNKVDKIVDFLRINGIFLEEMPEYKTHRRFKVDSILANDTLFDIFTNNVFNIIFWGKSIEIESKLGEKKKKFKYKDKDSILIYVKDVILNSGFYNDEYLNNKLIDSNFDFTLSNKVREMIDFFRAYGIIIERVMKNKNEMFSMLVSLGYIQLIIKYSSDDNYYLTVQTNTKGAISSEKLSIILNKLYGKGEENFWVESKPFYNKLEHVIDIYMNDRQSKELV